MSTPNPHDPTFEQDADRLLDVLKEATRMVDGELFHSDWSPRVEFFAKAKRMFGVRPGGEHGTEGELHQFRTRLTELHGEVDGALRNHLSRCVRLAADTVQGAIDRDLSDLKERPLSERRHRGVDFVGLSNTVKTAIGSFIPQAAVRPDAEIIGIGSPSIRGSDHAVGSLLPLAGNALASGQVNVNPVEDHLENSLARYWKEQIEQDGAEEVRAQILDEVGGDTEWADRIFGKAVGEVPIGPAEPVQDAVPEQVEDAVPAQEPPEDLRYLQDAVPEEVPAEDPKYLEPVEDAVPEQPTEDAPPETAVDKSTLEERPSESEATPEESVEPPAELTESEEPEIDAVTEEPNQSQEPTEEPIEADEPTQAEEATEDPVVADEPTEHDEPAEVDAVTEERLELDEPVESEGTPDAAGEPETEESVDPEAAPEQSEPEQPAEADEPVEAEVEPEREPVESEATPETDAEPIESEATPEADEESEEPVEVEEAIEDELEPEPIEPEAEPEQEPVELEATPETEEEPEQQVEIWEEPGDPDFDDFDL